MSARIVHMLHHGQALCGMPGVPGEWPEGHVWIPKDGPLSNEELREKGDAMCLGCMNAIATKTKAKGGPSTEQPARLRTLLVRMAIEVDASESDVVKAAEAIAERLREGGATIDRAILSASSPTEDAARAFWASKREIGDFAEAYRRTGEPMPERCPKCGGANHPREHAWFEKNYERIARRVMQRKASPREQKLFRASMELEQLKRQLGSLCGSAEGQTAKDRLAEAIRAIMGKEN